MNAILKVEKNYENNVLESEIMTLFSLYSDNLLPIEELSIENFNYEEKEGEVLELGDIIIESKKNKSYKPKLENIEKNSRDVFVVINNLGKLISDSIDEKTISKIEHNDNFEKHYKEIIKTFLLDKKNLYIALENIYNFINNFGFFSTTSNIAPLSDIVPPSEGCNIIEFIFVSYVIYESFSLRTNLANGTNNHPKLFNYTYHNATNEFIFKHINDVLEYLDNNYINSCFYKTTFDEENECWNTDLIFNNALALSIYELKMQLSKDNNDDTIGICENIACNRIFTRKGFKQRYCLSDDCNRIRQSQRKRKSRQQKNK